MNKIFRYFFVALFLAVLVSFIPNKCANASTLKKPSIELKNFNNITESLLVVGLTESNTEVLVYIDGAFIGMATVNSKNTKTDNYYFRFNNTFKEGVHEIKVIAKDKTSLLLSEESEVLKVAIEPIPVPMIIEPNDKTITAKVKPYIVGLTRAGTRVHFYIDGIYNGKTDYLSDTSKTANFKYLPFLNLSTGSHEVWIFAEDKIGRRSSVSKVFSFNVELPTPAPIIYKPIVNKNTDFRSPFIIGNVKNDLVVKVYIDNILNGTIETKKSSNKVTDFAYKPYIPLREGRHFAYVTAIDKRGKESKWSNIVYFNVTNPTITVEAAEEVTVLGDSNEEKINQEKEKIDDSGNEINKNKLESPVEQEKNNEKNEESRWNWLKNIWPFNKIFTPGIDSQSINGKTNNENYNKENEIIDEISKNETNREPQGTGLVTENNKKQGVLQMNLIVFIIFLAAVIGWIIWVNRELVKERKMQEENKE